MRIAPEKIAAYINFLYQRKYNTNAPPELLEKWNNVPYNLISLELNNLYTHWNMGVTETAQMEAEFNNQFAPSPPPVQNYQPTPAPPPFNPISTPNTAYEQPLSQPTRSSGGSPWKIITIVLIGIIAMAAAYYFYSQNNNPSPANKPSNDGSILSNNEIKREEPIAKVENPTTQEVDIDSPAAIKEDPTVAVEQEKTDRSQKIQRLLKAEDERDLTGILNMFDGSMLQYWDMKNPSDAQLRKRYMDSWSKIDDIKHKNVRIHRVSKNTYDITGDFSFFSLKDDAYKSVPIKTRVVFNDQGKIIRTYGVNK